MITRFISCAFLGTMLVSFSSAESLTIIPVADTTIHERFPGNNIGGHFDLASGGIASGERTRALIRFDLEGKIPPGSTITSATLMVQVTREPSSGGIQSAFDLRRMMSSWNEGGKTAASGTSASTGETTWNHRFSSDIAWASPGGVSGTDFAVQTSASAVVAGLGSYTFGSTPSMVADVRSWLEKPGSNSGWMLISQEETTPETARRFASREDALKAPRLTVEYSPGVVDARITGFSISNGNATVTWQGGTPPFQLQSRPGLDGGLWENTGSSTTSSSMQIPVSGRSEFFRLSHGAGVSLPAKTATYEVVFKSEWNSSTHPDSFPGGAHWSPLIGGTHNSSVVFWQEGVLASQGIKDVAELGSVVALRREVNGAVTNGAARSVLFRSGSIAPGGVAGITFAADRDFPLVTLVTMIAPSPDWFTGVHGLSLIENGAWVDQKTVVLDLYDSGTDSGNNYSSQDADTQPRELIRKITGFPALINGALVPFATLTFSRKP